MPQGPGLVSRRAAGRLAAALAVVLFAVGCDDEARKSECRAPSDACACDGGAAGEWWCPADASAPVCRCEPDDGHPPDEGPDADAGDGGSVCTAEVCNGLDDDCDGRFDEAMGEVCLRAGSCAEGTLVCRRRDEVWALACQVVGDGVGPAAHEEACNGLDDDCDGMADEGFSLDSDPAHCGGCDRDCAAPGGRPVANTEFGCMAGTCVVAGCAEGFVDADGWAGNGCECAPGTPDRPDPMIADDDCDGRHDEDPDPARSVFVSATRGDDTRDGGPDTPVRGLVRALELVDANGRSWVVMEVGAYDPFAEMPADESARTQGLEMPSGVHVVGSYRVDAQGWYRDPTRPEATEIGGAVTVLRYAGLDRPTLLDAVEVRALDGVIEVEGRPRGTSSIGIVAEQVGDHLLVANTLIESGDAGEGVSGQGGSGRVEHAGDGAAPSRDAVPFECPHVDAPERCGGLGGINRRCGTTVPVGGDGGHAGLPGERGEVHRTQAPALGGLPGAPGEVGESGLTGAMGSAAPVWGALDAAGRWSPLAGTDGAPGWPGGGGGGGGGSAVYGGGGGGSGGCPGQGGGAATSGYGTFGLYVLGGRVALMDRDLHDVEWDAQGPLRLSLKARRGGTGGTGGPGSRGGPGGAGGAGAPEDQGCPGCTPAGAGGAGGPGGCGGHGGAGSGGPSFAVFRVPPPGGGVHESGVVVIESVRDALDPAMRRPLGRVSQREAIAEVASSAGGGREGRAAQTAGCAEPGSTGVPGPSGAVGCCTRGEEDACALLVACEPS